jgi:hypothetical protein
MERGSAGDVASIGVLRVMDDGVDLQRVGPGKLVREMRMIKTEGMVQEGEVGGILLHWNGRSSPAAVACSGEKLFGPGSVNREREKGGRGEETGGYL